MKIERSETGPETTFHDLKAGEEFSLFTGYDVDKVWMKVEGSVAIQWASGGGGTPPNTVDLATGRVYKTEAGTRVRRVKGRYVVESVG